MTQSPQDLVEWHRGLRLRRLFLNPSKWWLRSTLLNGAALYVCRSLLSGIHLRGFTNYVFAAIAVELPAIGWWFAWLLWSRIAIEDKHPLKRRSRLWVITGESLLFVAPLLLATALPGLLLAEWLTPLQIDGVWTYVGSCAIIATILISLRGAWPLRYARRFIHADPTADPSPTGESA
jgi:uncharacterized membrane protein YvlD (DUF360 family)